MTMNFLNARRKPSTRSLSALEMPVRTNGNFFSPSTGVERKGNGVHGTLGSSGNKELGSLYHSNPELLVSYYRRSTMKEHQ